MLIYGYIIEIIIFLGWYKLIVKKEIKQQDILIRTIKLLVMYKKLIIKSMLSLVVYNKKGEEILTSIKTSIINLIYAFMWIIGYALLAPILLSLVIQNANTGLIGHIFYIIFLGALVILKLKDETQNAIRIFRNYIWSVILRLEDEPSILESYIEEKRDLNLDKKQKLIFLAIIILGIGFIIGSFKLQDFLEENIFSRYIVIMMLIIIAICDYVKKVKSKTRIEEVGVLFDSYEYCNIEESIRKMCKKLKIDNLKCGIWKDDGVNAEADINKDGIPEINVTTGFIFTLLDLYNKKEINNSKTIFEVTVAHELAHIYYKDHKNVKIRLRMCCLFWFVNLVAIILSVFLLKYSPIFVGIAFALYIVEFIFGKVMCDIRYWEQIAELKADRLGVSLCDGGKEAFIAFWGREKARERENQKIDSLNQSNILYRYYKRYIENEAHPSIERRLDLINKREVWKWWEYFEHALIIHKWRISKRGWNGR